MPDPFKDFASELDSPFTGGQAVTPADGGNGFQKTSRALWVGTEGNITVVTKDGDILSFVNFQGWMPGRIVNVKSTGTTATDITAVW